MVFLWGNTKTVKDRHAKEEQERTESLENWRAGVLVPSSSNAAETIQ